jgi:hypothetical protein
MARHDATLGQLLRSPSFLASAAGVVLLAAGSAALVALLTRDLVTPAPAPAAAARPAPLPVDPFAAPIPAAAPPVPQDPAIVRAVRARQAAAPAVTRMAPSRGRFLVTRAIEQQVPGLVACLPGRAPGAAALVASRRGLPAADTAGVLLLELEPGDGELRIVDATVGERGAASDAELACAARALKGRALAMPGNTAGPRVTMPFPL